MVQFKEHENGQKSPDPKIVKLDKLARLLNVKIHIDGVSYGGTGIQIPTEKVSEPVVDVKSETKPTKKSSPRAKKPVDKTDKS